MKFKKSLKMLHVKSAAKFLDQNIHLLMYRESQAETI